MIVDWRNWDLNIDISRLTFLEKLAIAMGLIFPGVVSFGGKSDEKGVQWYASPRGDRD